MILQLGGCHFQDVPETLKKSLAVQHVIPKSQYQRCFQQWQKWWTCRINSVQDCFREATMTDNNGKHIFPYQLSMGHLGCALRVNSDDELLGMSVIKRDYHKTNSYRVLAGEPGGKKSL
jgi:hypothetical protein